MEPLLGKTLPELEEVALACGLKRFAGKQLANWLYVHRAVSFDEMTNISVAGRQRLAELYSVGRHLPVAEAVSADGTRKYLFRVSTSRTAGSASPDKPEQAEYIETVYLPNETSATLCISTQSGCRMGCRFCMTGTLGFCGHLSAADILNQILFFPHVSDNGSPTMATGHLSGFLPLSNIVVMGEGEPMDNISPVLRALEVMTAPYGAAWSPHRITVSTVGAGEGLQRFLRESECGLAISLHNPFAAERAEIMPAERLRPLTTVFSMLRTTDFRHQRRLSFEYIIWSGKNDTLLHARELVRILKPFSPQCRLNLIRFHRSPEPNHQPKLSTQFPPTDEQRMADFAEYMNRNGVTTTCRRSRGQDILAACGMLVNSLQAESKNE